MRENLFSLKRQEQDLSGEHMDLAMQYQTGSISGLAYQAANAKTPEFRFSTEIPTMQAVSQGNTGRCWILAGLNLLREIAVRKMERESLPEGNFLFSPPPGYLAFWDKLEKADCFLEKAIQLGKLPYDNREVCSWFSYAITEGGFWNYFTDLVRKYGLVPYEKMPETACHSMLLTGVLEENGRPVHWKIENSYGIFGLHRGYYICSDSWFEKYMLSAVILKKYLKKYGKAWERAPHLFDIWEIM